MAAPDAVLDWLETARETLNRDPSFRKLGSTDMVLGLAIGNESRLVRFEAFEVAEIQTVRATDLRDADLVVRMSPENWNGWLRQRSRGQGPTLLTLELTSDAISAASPLARLKLARYNLSLQAFIDAGARLAA